MIYPIIYNKVQNNSTPLSAKVFFMRWGIIQIFILK